jgi:hypothetical protein
VGWRRWRLAVAVLATLGGLLAAGRLLELPQAQGPSAAPSPTAPVQVPGVPTTAPPATIPATLRRPLRLPGLRRDGSCPATPAVGPPATAAHPVAAVRVGDGPVYPVLFRAGGDGLLDQSVVVYWDAPRPLGGVVIVRGQRLGAPGDRIRFRDDNRRLHLVHVLDPATAYPAGPQGHWWRPTPMRAGPGCYGLQIDGSTFSEVLVVEFR